MKRNRYDLNDQSAYDGRPSRRQALSPRTPAPAIRASGTPGRATSGRPENPVSGMAPSASARRPKGNTMRNARMGGSRVHYFEPSELDATPRPTASAPPRIPNRRFDAGTHEKVLAAAESAGFRERAMQRHSVLIVNGAVDVIPRTGPVWTQDTNQHDQMTYGPARKAF